MSKTLTTAALSAAAITLTLSLSAPAFARGGDAIERKARQVLGPDIGRIGHHHVEPAANRFQPVAAHEIDAPVNAVTPGIA